MPAVRYNLGMGGARTEHARRLFDGIAPSYDAPAEIFSFAQYGRWRRCAVSKLGLAPDARVLDVASGTGLVARDLRRRYGVAPVALDQSQGMLNRLRSREARIVGASAERLPFRDATFDGLTFTYLLRYVDDPEAVIAELVRVIRPGGVMASVEFGVPPARWANAMWRVYSTRVLPAGARMISPGWREVGDFLGGSIERWGREFPPSRVAALWRGAGMTGVGVRTMSFGAGVVMWGRKRG